MEQLNPGGEYLSVWTVQQHTLVLTLSELEQLYY